ncbi:hypothetical protein NQ314_011400 [Rhamnusium bicolor]|uniref:Uncharacterized protein n=1 Tax=Rhamnusium bicolor TaxID=1586634 RepID=A0AAV8XJ27_9CUCU|nr:hypothetical protein NQ314_011400 [Rhamnusium bicolor]
MYVSQKQKKGLALVMLQEQDNLEEEIEILSAIHCRTRKSVSKLFQKRMREGAFKLLIYRHLLDDEVKFKAYFRFTRRQFSFLVNLIKEDLTVAVYNRVKNPISPAEKLAVTLRCVLTETAYYFFVVLGTQ